jgi:uracil phosphoribosyltransferase
VPVEYYLKFPEDMGERQVIVVDPMLATGHSAIAALDRVRESDAANIKFLCLVASPEGIANLQEAHPDVPVFAAAIDRALDEDGYILPGIGDAGNRLYGTK